MSGHIGIMCSVCADDHFYDSAAGSCKLCSGTNMFTPALIIALLALFFSLFCAAIAYHYCNSHGGILMKYFNSGKVAAFFEWAQRRQAPLMAKFKIILVTYQIVWTSADALQVSQPPGHLIHSVPFKFHPYHIKSPSFLFPRRSPTLLHSPNSSMVSHFSIFLSSISCRYRVRSVQTTSQYSSSRPCGRS